MAVEIGERLPPGLAWHNAHAAGARRGNSEPAGCGGALCRAAALSHPQHARVRPKQARKRGHARDRRRGDIARPLLPAAVHVNTFNYLIEQPGIAFQRKDASDEEFARSSVVELVEERSRPSPHLCDAQSINARLHPLVKFDEIGRSRKADVPTALETDQPRTFAASS